MGGHPQRKFQNTPASEMNFRSAFFYKKISTIRKCISENTSWGVSSEMNFRKHLMGGVFGYVLPKTHLFRFWGVSEMNFRIMQKLCFFLCFFLTVSHF